MHGLSFTRLSLGLLTGLGLLLLPSLGRAVDKDEVKFDSFDGVELHGTFYPALNGGTKAPCVLLVHNIGGNRAQNGWDELALALQKKDYAVLSFDLRGHGDSQSVDPTVFWTQQANASYFPRLASAKKDKISYKEFNRGYYPMLVNDIAAAKHYLDQQNNARVCNSSSVIVIGAEEGAALAALWIATEYQRHRVARDALGRLVPGKAIEGEDIACAIWLSMSPQLSGVNVSNWLRTPVREKVPMAFIYSKSDTTGSTAANSMVATMKGGPGAKALPFTAALAKEGKAVGNALLGKPDTLNTEEQIVNYITKVRDKRADTVWDDREKAPIFPIPLTQWGFPNLVTNNNTVSLGK